MEVEMNFSTRCLMDGFAISNFVVNGSGLGSLLSELRNVWRAGWYLGHTMKM